MKHKLLTIFLLTPLLLPSHALSGPVEREALARLFNHVLADKLPITQTLDEIFAVPDDTLRFWILGNPEAGVSDKGLIADIGLNNVLSVEIRGVIDRNQYQLPISLNEEHADLLAITTTTTLLHSRRMYDRLLHRIYGPHVHNGAWLNENILSKSPNSIVDPKLVILGNALQAGSEINRSDEEGKSTQYQNLLSFFSLSDIVANSRAYLLPFFAAWIGLSSETFRSHVTTFQNDVFVSPFLRTHLDHYLARYHADPYQAFLELPNHLELLKPSWKGETEARSCPAMPTFGFRTAHEFSARVQSGEFQGLVQRVSDIISEQIEIVPLPHRQSTRLVARDNF